MDERRERERGTEGRRERERRDIICSRVRILMPREKK
jgi:hypothetical protein